MLRREVQMPTRRVGQRFRVAAVQMTSTEDVARNLVRAEASIRAAVEAGADLVALPESYNFV